MPEGIKKAKELESTKELNNYLNYAYTNGIDLDSKNAIKDDYRGESLENKYELEDIQTNKENSEFKEAINENKNTSDAGVKFDIYFSKHLLKKIIS